MNTAVKLTSKPNKPATAATAMVGAVPSPLLLSFESGAFTFACVPAGAVAASLFAAEGGRRCGGCSGANASGGLAGVSPAVLGGDSCVTSSKTGGDSGAGARLGRRGVGGTRGVGVAVRPGAAGGGLAGGGTGVGGVVAAGGGSAGVVVVAGGGSAAAVVDGGVVAAGGGFSGGVVAGGLSAGGLVAGGASAALLPGKKLDTPEISGTC